ncbi:uncharacterized protein LOC114520268 [Dendronephthya gigantea]|uniref:uncharacterized protein LOC114520268 n=1 Tax=Dendronephthya gigantea TaxID=151771 RepID=UPI00106CF539|nr:uncharacterized protein LOC114520268 [Dendronephthya gigantea]
MTSNDKPNIWQRLCINDMKDSEKAVICRTLGYSDILPEQPDVGRNSSRDSEMPVIHGNVYCNSNENNISACCLEKVDTDGSTCLSIARVSCSICSEPVLSSKNHPVVMFSASSFLPGYPADRAAITSGSAWCARDADGSHDYLKIDVNMLYVIKQLSVLGEVKRGNWVQEYEVLYSADGNDWLPVIVGGKNRLTGNSASDKLSSVVFDETINARFLKIFPKSWQGTPCMRIEICGHKLLPDAPMSLTLTHVTAHSADLSWLKPSNVGDGGFTDYQIILFRDGNFDSNYTSKVEIKHFSALRPYTKYSVVVQAGNQHGYGLKAELTFRTNSTAPSSPPMNIVLSPVTSSSLKVSWEKPPSSRRNGIINGYEVCFGWVKSVEECDVTLRTSASIFSLGYLSSATEYKVKVLARNDAGSGNYSEEYSQITNADAPVCNRPSITSETFAVKLQKPRGDVKFCQVVVLALSSDGRIPNHDIYSLNPATYLDAADSSVPYIAAEFRASDFFKYQTFTVGNRSIYPALSSLNARGNEAKRFLNGPLAPNTSYTLFQRFLSDKKVLYFSDFLDPVETSGVKMSETRFQGRPKYENYRNNQFIQIVKLTCILSSLFGSTFQHSALTQSRQRSECLS